MGKKKKGGKFHDVSKSENASSGQVSRGLDRVVHIFSIAKKRIRPLLTKRNVFIGVVALLFLIQYVQIQSVFGTFSFLQGRDSSLITEIGMLREGYGDIGDDLSEVRRFLGMGTRSYESLDELDADESPENALQLAIFQYVDFVAAEHNSEQLYERNAGALWTLVGDAAFVSHLDSLGLVVGGRDEADAYIQYVINAADGGEICVLYLDKSNGELYMKSILEKMEMDSEDYDSFQVDAIDFVDRNAEDVMQLADDLITLRGEISSAIASGETITVASKKGLTIDADPVEEDLKLTYSIYNSSQELIAKIVVATDTLKISLIDVKDTSSQLQISDIGKSLVPFLENLDTRTILKKKADESLGVLEETIADKGFQLLLSENDMLVSDEPREDTQRVYYEITDLDGIVLGMIVMEKGTGVVTITDPDGTNSQNILLFDPDSKKKTIDLPSDIPDYPEYFSDDGSFNVLVAGKHGSLVDTMIFVHIDEATRKIHMVSIPRDLFYNGRKINHYASMYGMPELKNAISKITGYELDKYILIDMYAFIDVVDLIGGIDVTLESAVIDPTYRTVDNGVEGTLHYEPGDYHLGGKEALRLARSRHTSSDFARAERQQMILEALQEKAQGLGFGDADTLYELAKTVLDMTETDIGLDEAIRYYFKYQNYEVASMAVMSSGNILYVPPYVKKEDCEAGLIEGEDCENGNFAYTLLPRDDDWDVIKWFFKEQFEQ